VRLFFDIDLQKFVLGPGTTQELLSIEQKRSPNSEIEIQFLRGVTPQELVAGASGIFEVKETGKYDANAIFRAASWVKTGTGVDTIYTFTLDLQNASGDLLLGVDNPITVTATNASDTFNATAHGLSDTNKVQFSTDGTLPAGLLENQDYFVINSTANTFKVSLTSGGSAVNITTDGSGTHKVRRIDNDGSSVNLMAAMQYVAGGKTIESQTFVFEYVNDVVRDGDTSPVAVPEDIVLNVRSGKQAITNGTDTGSVVFGTAFTAGANVDVVAVVAKPAGGDNIFATVKDDAVTETGFDYELSAEVPATGYKLNWMAVAI
jgi:hypothetical protein